MCCVQADATALDFDALDEEEGPFTIAVSFLTSGAARMTSDLLSLSPQHTAARCGKAFQDFCGRVHQCPQQR
jgi:hypothetical protein